MTEETVTLREVDESTLTYVESVLTENGLPAADVRSKPDCFYVATHDGTRVGIGGLEPHGTAGLLRSVVIEESTRGTGLGTALCRSLEKRATAQRIETLYLLTTTAADFFADCRYVEIERDAAPPAIQGTTQFSDYCPDSATCMQKRLD